MSRFPLLGSLSAVGWPFQKLPAVLRHCIPFHHLGSFADDPSYTGGMVIMDAVHAPTGCGTWPAWWMNGDNWPYGGEIDIMEGVNAFSQNQISIHTGSGCRIPQDTNQQQTGTLTSGWFDSYNCASYETGNEGCGVRDLTNPASFGEGFNAAGGGVYARES